MVRYHIGIDPGVRGAIAYIGTDGVANTVNVPTVEIIPNKKTSMRKNILNMALAAEILSQFCGRSRLVIEDVHAFPKMGKVQCFDFGMNFGQLLGIIEALKIPYSRVPAVTWKKAICAQLGNSKGASITRACQLRPELSSQFSWITPQGVAATDDGRAEALLIAEYARQNFPFESDMTTIGGL